MKAIIENNLISKFIKNYSRSPLQLNHYQGSDAEIIKLPTDSEIKIAITTDSIVEEIISGLYDDPYLIGWMIVMVNLSDLAAVGANPIGILISETLKNNLAKEYLDRLHSGINDACKKCGTFVLGGDTNFGPNLILTGCAIGTIEISKQLSRVGCKEGDLIYSSGNLGYGNAFAFSKLVAANNKFEYLPYAKIAEGQIISKIATSCMDTSDGAIATLDQIMRLNKIGAKLYSNWEKCIDPKTIKLCEEYNLPVWLMLAGQHGEFELIFTIDKKDEQNLEELSSKINWNPIKLGEIIKNQNLILPLYNHECIVDSAQVRNLPNLTKGKIRTYIDSLISMDSEFKCN